MSSVPSSSKGAARGHHPIAVGHVPGRVAAVECLHIGQDRRCPGPPRELAGVCAAKAQVLGTALVQGQGCEGAERPAVAAEDPHFLGEAGVRHKVRIRTDRADREEVFAAGRRLQGLVHGRGADGPCVSRLGVDEGGLRREVVVEQRLVVGILQHVLKGPGRGGLAPRFLDDRPDRDCRRHGREAAVFEDKVAEQRTAARHPGAGFAPGAVQRGAGQGAGGARLRVGQPEGDAVGGRSRESEAVARGRPDRWSQTVLGAGHLPRVTAVQVDDREAHERRRGVHAVGDRADPAPGQPQHGRGEIFDPGHALAVCEYHPFAGRADHRLGQRGGVQDFDNIRGWCTVGVLRDQLAGWRWEQGGQRENGCGAATHLHGSSSWRMDPVSLIVPRPYLVPRIALPGNTPSTTSPSRTTSRPSTITWTIPAEGSSPFE